MNLVYGHTGWLEVICGLMFSRKSEVLIRRRRALIARRRVAAFQPVIDTRYSAEEIVPHSELRIPSLPVRSPREILDRLEARTEATGIDEANFPGPDLPGVASRLADMGRQVIIAGPDTDCLGRPFEPIPALPALAGDITERLAICLQCGGPAKFTQRLVQSPERIVIGSVGLYEARGRRRFEPGVPRRQALGFLRPAAPGKVSAG